MAGGACATIMDIWWGKAARELKVHTTQSLLICRFVVCTSVELFGCVKGFSRVPRYSLPRNILSMTPGMIIGQGIPYVREFWQLHTLLRHLSPQGVG